MSSSLRGPLRQFWQTTFQCHSWVENVPASCLLPEKQSFWGSVPL